METGRQLIAEADVRAWARLTQAEPEPLLALRAKAAAEYESFQERRADTGILVAAQDELTALAQSCTWLAEYQPVLVPGRLQTPDYIREKALGNRELIEKGLPPDKVGLLVAAKLRRQAILYEPDREFVHIVGEAALHTRLGAVTASTLKAQVVHLAQMSSLPGHTFGVIPFHAGVPVAPIGFALYDRDLVRVETSNGVVQIAEPDAVARHVRWLDQLLEVAVTGAEAAEFCRTLADTMDTG